MTGPTIAELLSRPERVAELSPDEAHAMLVQLGGLVVMLSARLATAPDAAPSANGSRFLTPAEVGVLLGIDREQVWRYARRKSWAPFTRRVSRKCIRFEERGFKKWLATQTGRP